MSQRKRILLYTVSKDEAVLAGFLEEARQHYTALEEAIVPLDAKIEERVPKNWYPVPTPFWKPILEKNIPAICQAAQACLYLFAKERSTQEAPIPIVIGATYIEYVTDLLQITHEIEESGILLTACLCRVLSQSLEEEIRECRRLLLTLQQLSKTVHKALNTSRALLDEAPEEQARLLASPIPKETKAEQPKRPVLWVVKDNGEEGAE